MWWVLPASLMCVMPGFSPRSCFPKFIQGDWDALVLTLPKLLQPQCCSCCSSACSWMGSPFVIWSVLTGDLSLWLKLEEGFPSVHCCCISQFLSFNPSSCFLYYVFIVHFQCVAMSQGLWIHLAMNDEHDFFFPPSEGIKCPSSFFSGAYP